MRILMTGATGLIGRELGKALAARGDTLACLVRGGRAHLPFPADCFDWRHDRPVPKQALAGVDAIVNLAGEPVADGRWTPRKKALIRDSRVLGTRALVQAALESGAALKAFVQGSAIGYWGDRGDEVLTGRSPKAKASSLMSWRTSRPSFARSPKAGPMSAPRPCGRASCWRARAGRSPRCCRSSARAWRGASATAGSG